MFRLVNAKNPMSKVTRTRLQSGRSGNPSWPPGSRSHPTFEVDSSSRSIQVKDLEGQVEVKDLEGQVEVKEEKKLFLLWNELRAQAHVSLLDYFITANGLFTAAIFVGAGISIPAFEPHHHSHHSSPVHSHAQYNKCVAPEKNTKTVFRDETVTFISFTMSSLVGLMVLLMLLLLPKKLKSWMR